MTEEKIKLTQFSKGGGCGCKIAPAVLQEIIQTTSKGNFPSLLVGNESSDDAAVYQLNDETAIVSTTDFFLPIVDDAFDFGRIAAANAISDVYAMGGKPLMAIAILGWPTEKINTAEARRVLEGGRSICLEAGIPLAGGHTIDSSDPIFGLAVTGTVSLSNLKKNNTAKPGDIIFLTKPIGVGMMATAIKRKLLDEADYPALVKQLSMLNKAGADLGKIAGVNAMTDVTGFGLLGHLVEMSEGSKLSAEIKYPLIPKMDRVAHYLQLKTIPDATSRNWNSYGKKIEFGSGVNVMEAFNLLPDPQTNGGLLIAVEPSSANEVQKILRDNHLHAEPIGVFTEQKEKTVFVLNE